MKLIKSRLQVQCEQTLTMKSVFLIKHLDWFCFLSSSLSVFFVVSSVPTEGNELEQTHYWLQCEGMLLAPRGQSLCQPRICWHCIIFLQRQTTPLPPIWSISTQTYRDPFSVKFIAKLSQMCKALIDIGHLPKLGYDGAQRLCSSLDLYDAYNMQTHAHACIRVQTHNSRRHSQ